MTRGWPVTVWAYILGDLWRLVLLTTAVLVAVLAFALTIRPLADGKLDPVTAMRWMGLAMIPMLQYALPFAACFAATLTYNRMAVDNELTACYAGGLSHRSLLAPALASGLVLAGVLLWLNNWAIPRTFRVMSELATTDASRMIITSIKRGEAIEFEHTLVYADQAIPQGPDEASGAYQRIALVGVLVVRVDKSGKVESQGSARTAAVWLRRSTRAGAGGADDTAVTEVIVKPNDFVATGPDFRVGGADTVLTFIVPNTLSDNPKYLSFDELRALRRAPERMNFIDRPRRELAIMISAREVADGVRGALRASGACEFRDPYGQRVVLRAGGLRPTRRADGTREPSVLEILPAQEGRSIVVERTTSEGRVQRQNAASAFLRLPVRPDSSQHTVPVTLQLRDVASEPVAAAPTEAGEDPAEVQAPPELPPGARGELKERPLADLTLVDDPTSDLIERSSWELETRADALVKDTRPVDREAIAEPRRRLKNRIEDLLREVLGKEHERYAMSGACLVMVITGAVMAMRLRNALPLTIYLWAFFPALASVLAISGGLQLTHGQGLVGLPVLWSGVVLLGGYAVFEFTRLAKH